MPILPTQGLASETSTRFFEAAYMSFLEALSSEAVDWSTPISNVISSAALQVRLPIDVTNLGIGFKRWGGDRDAVTAEMKAIVIGSSPWERTVDIPIDILAAAQEAGTLDALQPFLNKVPGIIRNAQKHRDIRSAAFLQDTTKTTALDGLAFFHAAHLIDPSGRLAASRTYQNLRTSFGLNLANYATLRAYLRGIKDPSGVSSLGLQLTHLLVPPELENQALYVVRRANILEDSDTNDAAAAVTNVFADDSAVIVAPELSNEPDVWYGLALNGEERPLTQVWKNNGEPEVRVMGEGSEHATKTNMMQLAAKIFGEVGEGMPFTIHRCQTA